MVDTHQVVLCGAYNFMFLLLDPNIGYQIFYKKSTAVPIISRTAPEITSHAPYGSNMAIGSNRNWINVPVMPITAAIHQVIGFGGENFIALPFEEIIINLTVINYST